MQARKESQVSRGKGKRRTRVNPNSVSTRTTAPLYTITGTAIPKDNADNKLVSSRNAAKTRLLHQRAVYGDTRGEFADNQLVSYDPNLSSSVSQDLVRVDKAKYTLNTGAVATLEDWENENDLEGKLHSACWVVPERFETGQKTFNDARGVLRSLRSTSVTFHNNTDCPMKIHINAPKSTLASTDLIKVRAQQQILELRPSSSVSFTTGFRAEQNAMPVYKPNGTGRRVALLFDYAVLCADVNKYTGAYFAPKQPLVDINISVNYTCQAEHDVGDVTSIVSADQVMEVNYYPDIATFLRVETDPVQVRAGYKFPKSNKGTINRTHLRAVGRMTLSDGKVIAPSSEECYWVLWMPTDKLSNLPSDDELIDWESIGCKEGDYVELDHSFAFIVGINVPRTVNVRKFRLLRLKKLEEFEGAAAEVANLSDKLVAVATQALTAAPLGEREQYINTWYASGDLSADIYYCPKLINSDYLLAYTVIIVSPDTYAIANFFKGLFKILSTATKVAEVLTTLF